MSGSLRIDKWIDKGFEEILSSAGTQGVIASATDSICANANANNTRGGKGFASSTRLGTAGKGWKVTRALGFVYTTDRKSIIAEAEDKALSRAVM